MGDQVDQLIQALTARVRANADRAAPRPTKPAKYVTTMNFNLWLQSFNAFCDAVDIPEDERRPHLLALLDLSTAYAAVDKLDLPADMDYGDFTARLVDRFTMHRTIQDYRCELSNRDQLERESAESYGDELLELARNAFPNADADTRNELAKDRFLKGVRVTDTIRERLYLQQPADLTEAIRTVRQLEAAQKASASHQKAKPRAGLSALGTHTGEESEVRQLRQRIKDMEEQIQQLHLRPSQTGRVEQQDGASALGPRERFGAAGRNREGSSQPRTGQQTRGVTCFRCGQPGHLSFQCQEQGKANRSPRPGGK